jgi:hypothetical protein
LLAAWTLVCKPKKYGGLGVLNLELQNKALLLKQLHKLYTKADFSFDRYTKADVPWVRLVWSLYGDSVPHAHQNVAQSGGEIYLALWRIIEVLGSALLVMVQQRSSGRNSGLMMS